MAGAASVISDNGEPVDGGAAGALIDFRTLVTSVVQQSGGRIGGNGEVVTITPGPLLVHCRRVPGGSFEATFSRSVALAAENKGLAFLTPAHPLVRAVLHRVRSGRYNDNPQDRIAVRAITAGQPGWLFTGRTGADLEHGQLG